MQKGVVDLTRVIPRQGEETVIFMHIYKDDLADKEEASGLNRLIASHDVALVHIGHTHYSKLAKNGHTIFAATR